MVVMMKITCTLHPELPDVAREWQESRFVVDLSTYAQEAEKVVHVLIRFGKEVYLAGTWIETVSTLDGICRQYAVTTKGVLPDLDA